MLKTDQAMRKHAVATARRHSDPTLSGRGARHLLKVEVSREHSTAAKAAIMNDCSAACGGYEDESGT
jgi:hypothetical protein